MTKFALQPIAAHCYKYKIKNLHLQTPEADQINSQYYAQSQINIFEIFQIKGSSLCSQGSPMPVLLIFKLIGLVFLRRALS